MRNVEFLRKVYWVLWILVLLVFYYSLRHAGEQAMEFTLLALLVWGITFALNRYIKKLENQENNKDL